MYNCHIGTSTYSIVQASTWPTSMGWRIYSSHQQGTMQKLGKEHRGIVLTQEESRALRTKTLSTSVAL